MEVRAYEEITATECTYWWYVVRRQLVARLVEKYSGGKMGRWLDVGCGGGSNVERWVQMGARVVCVDIAEEALRVARSRCSEAEFVLGDAQSLPFGDGEFDVVTALDVIEHLDDDAQAVKEMYRVLRKGGVAVVTVPA